MIKDENEFDPLLKNINKKIKLDKAEIDFLKSIIKSRTIQKNEVILKPNMTCYSTIFVATGCLRSYYLTNGKIQILQFAIQDWWIGDLKSFLRQTPSEMYIDAIAKTEILQISHQNIQNLYKRFPKFERFFRLLMESALIAHQDRILQLHTLTAKERYEKFKKNYQGFHNNIPQKDIANYLGMTPEYLSNLRNYKNSDFLR